MPLLAPQHVTACAMTYSVTSCAETYVTCCVTTYNATSCVATWHFLRRNVQFHFLLRNLSLLPSQHIMSLLVPQLVTSCVATCHFLRRNIQCHFLRRNILCHFLRRNLSLLAPQHVTSCSVTYNVRDIIYRFYLIFLCLCGVFCSKYNKRGCKIVYISERDAVFHRPVLHLIRHEKFWGQRNRRITSNSGHSEEQAHVHM